MTSNNDFLQNMLAHPLKATVAYYATCLVACAKAVAYLARNCLAFDAALQVGFADRTLGTHFPSNMNKAGKEIRSKLESVGIYRPNGREHFRGFVTVPLTNIDGAVTGIYGRRIDRNGDGPAELTIGGGIFNSQALRTFDEIIVTDNVLDAWTFYSAEHTNVVCGAMDVSDFKHVKRVLLTSDTIDCEAFGGCEIYRVKFPVGQSAHAYLLAQRDNQADPLGTVIRAAGWESRTIVPIVQAAAEASAEVNGTEKVGAITIASQATIETIVRHSLASPVPIKLDDLQVTVTADEITITTEWRRYRVRGLERNALPGVMKINLLVYNERTERFHVDSFDLYHARSRRMFTMEAADEIGADESQLRSDLGRVLLKLEQLQAEQKQLGKSSATGSGLKQLTDNEKREALELLQSNNLLDRILDDFEACGIVGERTGKLAGYLAATSRLLDRPLGLIIQSASAAGKSSLMNAILAFMPEEQQFSCSAMTGQSLYYAANVDFRHKILSIAEEQGMRDASYALKLLQSEGHLSIVTTGKERGTGRTNVERYQVDGPVAIVLTTTSINIDPELENRCLVISVDEDREQTLAIQARQREAQTFEEFVRAETAIRVCANQCNAQRLLRPLRVINRYADQLHFPADRTRDRRDHHGYLALIQSIALLHQYQRPVQQTQLGGRTVEYLEVIPNDIAVANTLISAILGSTIDDLPSQTRRLLIQLHDYVRLRSQELSIEGLENVRFTRREIRERLKLGQTQLAMHLSRLVQYEYIQTYPINGRKLHYGLNWDGRGREGELILGGLVDPMALSEPAPITTLLSAQELE